MMKHAHKVNKLAKFLTYVLGRRPDEFGLCPDGRGYVKIKELLKVMAEEAGWHHVRQGHLNEVATTMATPPVQIEGKRIRARDRSQLITPQPPRDLPKLLYYPLRRRAYGHALEKGVVAASDTPILIHRQRAMAERMGRRIDSSATILTVNSDQLLSRGNHIQQYGSDLFLTDGLPAGCFSGPPLAEEKTADKAGPGPKPAAPKTPGSYYLNLSLEHSAQKPLDKSARKRKNEWKRERRQKNRMRQ